MKHPRIGAFLLLILSVGCSQAPQPDPLDSVDGDANRTEVAKRLHDDNLISIPEVRTESQRWVEKWKSDELTREEAAKGFRLWLDEWMDTHQAKVEAAKGRPK